MSRKEFERILEISLTQLEAGLELEVILKENPRFSAELEPLLQAALLARSLPEPNYQESMREGRNRLLAETDRMKKEGAFTINGTKPAFIRYSGQWLKNIGDLLVGKENSEMKLLPRLAIYGLMTVLVAGFFTVNASASSLPGDNLYGLKLGLEQTRLALAFDDDSHQELEEEFEDERLEEVESLLGEGREEDVEFHGVIEEKGTDTWLVSGISVAVDTQTELKGALEVGDLVKVEALTQADGSLLALEIYGEGADMDDEIDSEDEIEIEEEDEFEVEEEDEAEVEDEEEVEVEDEDEIDSDDDVDDSSSDDDDSDSSDDSSDEPEEPEEEEEEEESDD